MKKFFLLVLCMLLICTAFSAIADDQAGKMVTVSVSVSNPNKACVFDVNLSYDSSALAIVSANGNNGAVAGKDGFSYSSPTPFAGGNVGTVSFQLKDTAVPGNTYKVSAYNAGAYDMNDNEVAITVSTSGGTVSMSREACDHTYKETGNEPASCIETGKSTLTCVKCGDSITQTLPMTEHTYDAGKITKEPTCKDEGIITFTCTVCGATKETAVKVSGQHTPGENKRVDQAPTCTKEGKGSYQCTVCGAWIEDSTIPATGHSLRIMITAATCGKDGQKASICANCDFNEVTDIPATGEHTYDNGVVTVEPACGVEGEKTFTCTVCGDKKTEKIDSQQHSYTSEVIAEPTCSKEGATKYTCTVCGDTYAEAIPAKGHTPGSDLKQQDPTCSKPGYKYYTCAVCGAEVKEDSIPATGNHIFKITEEKPATCTAKGKRVSTCTYGCGKTKTETLKALGHKMGEWTFIKEPNCNEKGQQTRTCENKCGKTETKSIKALGHDWGEWVVTKPVTEKEMGEKQHTCKRCGKVETKKISNHVDYYMTVCSEGIRFRDLKNPITKEWYMFTPIDLSVEGAQTFDLIAGNIHKIGKVTVLVQDGTVTVTYRVNNSEDYTINDEFMTILPSLSEMTRLDFDRMTNYAYGEPISIEETLGGDTKVLLLLRNHVAYNDNAGGLESFNSKGRRYAEFVEELKKLMD